MNFPRREIVDRIKKEYPEGTRVELVSMNDPYRNIPAGTKGTVIGVDDTGTIHCSWDNNGCLGIVYGEDSCRKIKTIKVTCYGDTEEWEDRQQAIEFYLKGVMASEGSEQARYSKILAELSAGMEECSDE